MVTVAPLTGIENDPNDADNSATRKVWVNYPPQAQLTATGTSTVAFNAAGSNDNLDLDGKGGIVCYDWDFGDGMTATDAGPVVSHTYLAGGNYNATVTVVDNNSEIATASVVKSVPFTVTASAGFGGTITPAGQIAVAPGGNQAFGITPEAGYHILSVEGCGGTLAGSTYTTGPITGDCSVTASFARDTFALLVATSGSGAVTSSPAGVDCGGDSVCMAVYENGTSVTLTASGNSDSFFAGWGGACAGTGSCTVGMNADTTVTAEFNQYVKVTSPKGGDVWDRGTVQNINWKYDGDNGTSVKIELVKGATVVETIAENAPIGSQGTGTYNWTVPSALMVGADYRIKITSTSNADHTDMSNGEFTIR